MISLTEKGRKATKRHWQLLEQLQKSAEQMTSLQGNAQINLGELP